MYTPNKKHFRTQEWVDKKTFAALHGDPARIWRLFDDRILRTADLLRVRYGPIIMNDYHVGGTNQFRGFRPFDCEIGAKWSDHKFGRAGDFVFRNVTAEEVRQDTYNNPDAEAFKFITVIENGVDWFHCATRNVKGILRIDSN